MKSLESILVGILQRLGRRRIHLERIDRTAILPNAEIQVRTGRAACRTDITDDFTLTDTLAFLDALGIFRKVEISGGIY